MAMQIYLPMRIADIRHTSDILFDNAEFDADIRVVMVIPNLIPCKISLLIFILIINDIMQKCKRLQNSKCQVSR